MFLNWIKSFFINSNDDIRNNIPVSFEPPYSLLAQASLTIPDINHIQKIIEEYGNQFNENDNSNQIIQKVYTELLSISSEDENIRLYLHELMLFSSIRMEKAIFYVELTKLIKENYPHLLSFLKSQIFWCFDNFADIFVYLSISKQILDEKDLYPFEKSVTFDMSFYFTTDSNYNPFYSYMRFLYLIEETKRNFHYSRLESFYEQVKSELNNKNYKNEMRKCLNMDKIAIAIREDNSEFIEGKNRRINLSLIDRNEMTMFGCSFLQYSAFYGSIKCFKKLSTKENFSEEKKSQKNQQYDFIKNKYYVLPDYAASGGEIEICKIVIENDFEFSSNSLLCAIRYHREDVFNWLINEIKIKMDESCIKASFQYEFIPAIEMINTKINVNFELSKSCNYVLFSKFVMLESMNNSEQSKKMSKYKYAELMPIFLYNSVDCIRFILTKKLDLNECCSFEPSFSRFQMHDQQYRNPFHVAIKHQFSDLIMMILNYGSIDPNKCEVLLSSGGLATLGFSTEKKLTPLEIALYTDNIDIVNLILSIDAIDVNQMCFSCYIYGHSNKKCNLSIFYAAALHENLEILENILKSSRIDKSIKSNCITVDTGFTVYRNQEINVDVLKEIKNKKVFDILSKYV